MSVSCLLNEVVRASMSVAGTASWLGPKWYKSEGRCKQAMWGHSFIAAFDYMM